MEATTISPALQSYLTSGLGATTQPVYTQSSTPNQPQPVYAQANAGMIQNTNQDVFDPSAAIQKEAKPKKNTGKIAAVLLALAGVTAAIVYAVKRGKMPAEISIEKVKNPDGTFKMIMPENFSFEKGAAKFKGKDYTGIVNTKTPGGECDITYQAGRLVKSVKGAVEKNYEFPENGSTIIKTCSIAEKTAAQVTNEPTKKAISTTIISKDKNNKTSKVETIFNDCVERMEGNSRRISEKSDDGKWTLKEKYYVAKSGKTPAQWVTKDVKTGRITESANFVRTIKTTEDGKEVAKNFVGDDYKGKKITVVDGKVIEEMDFNENDVLVSKLATTKLDSGNTLEQAYDADGRLIYKSEIAADGTFWSNCRIDPEEGTSMEIKFADGKYSFTRFDKDNKKISEEFSDKLLREWENFVTC